MKVFNLRDLYNAKYEEYIVGSEQTGRHTVYLVYGELANGQSRELAPDGHDEIMLLLAGEARLENDDVKVKLTQDQAVDLGPQGAFRLTALTDCRYVVAGTHVTPHRH